MIKRAYILLLIFSFLFAQYSIASNDKDWSMARALCRDRKARQIGDLLTVIIEEKANIEMSAKNSSQKSSAASGQMSFGHPRLDSRASPWTNAVLPAWSLETERSFEGDGSMENNNEFTSKITVRVTDVAPNGNLMIEGKRSVVIQSEDVVVITTGTVRPEDISRDNTVNSSRIADTAVRYMSSGPMVRGQKRGLLMSLLNLINPF
jgi:flagellar L-ring protein FlgH